MHFQPGGRQAKWQARPHRGGQASQSGCGEHFAAWRSKAARPSHAPRRTPRRLIDQNPRAYRAGRPSRRKLETQIGARAQCWLAVGNRKCVRVCVYIFEATDADGFTTAPGALAPPPPVAHTPILPVVKLAASRSPAEWVRPALPSSSSRPAPQSDYSAPFDLQIQRAARSRAPPAPHGVIVLGRESEPGGWLSFRFSSLTHIHDRQTLTHTHTP